jgi:acyl-CoA dehydrogenase
VQNCLYQIQIACNEFANNFPVRWLGKLLHAIIFPWGPAYKKPCDGLYHKIVSFMLEPSDFRNRLTRFCYLGKDNNAPARRIDEALALVESVEPIMKKFQVATRNGKVPKLGSLKVRADAAVKANILTADEAQALQQYDALHQEIIKVDEFSFDLSSVIQ